MSEDNALLQKVEDGWMTGEWVIEGRLCELKTNDRCDYQSQKMLKMPHSFDRLLVLWGLVISFLLCHQPHCVATIDQTNHLNHGWIGGSVDWLIINWFINWLYRAKKEVEMDRIRSHDSIRVKCNEIWQGWTIKSSFHSVALMALGDKLDL